MILPHQNLVKHSQRQMGHELEFKVSDSDRDPANRSKLIHDCPVPAQIMQLLGHVDLRELLTQHQGGIDDDEDDNMGPLRRLRRRKSRKSKITKDQFFKLPSEEGQKLMSSGVFGSDPYYRDRRTQPKNKLSRKLLSRELGVDRGQASISRGAIAQVRHDILEWHWYVAFTDEEQDLLPSSTADTIIHHDARCYSGQFSDDGNFFFSCAQDFNVRMYDTSNPFAWKYYKTVHYHYGQWTITDATLSPDNRYLAYSSIRSQVCLAPTDPNESSDPWILDFSDMGQHRRQGRYHGYASNFGIWSIRFSGDGRELVAGTGDHSVYVYDIEKRQSVLRIPGHNDDVNAVCFGDTSSPHILYSGSDDSLIKVWDRRSMGDSREAGVFMGHTEGITYVDSKGDGRYVLSNSKDQTMKLWDLRKMTSTEKASSLNPGQYATGFDYRFMTFSEEDWQPHPQDCSLVTFRGHSVLKTLIRCHFSPPGSTNSRYVYSGSEDGSVYIYNMDATLAGKIDVNSATYHSRPRKSRSDATYYMHDESSSQGVWKTCVRDASWHPNAPIIAATSWNGWGMATGTCTMHCWNDGAEDDEGTPEMGHRVDSKLGEDPKLSDNGVMSTRQRRLRTGLRSRSVQRTRTADRGAARDSGTTASWW